MVFSLARLYESYVLDTGQNEGGLPSVFWHLEVAGIIKRLKNKPPH